MGTAGAATAGVSARVLCARLTRLNSWCLQMYLLLCLLKRFGIYRRSICDRYQRLTYRGKVPA